MDAEDIIRKINQCGCVTKTIFYTFIIYHLDNSVVDDFYFSVDDILTYYYNITLGLMKKIQDNPDYFEKRCNISKRRRSRMCDDLKKMYRLDYSDDAKFIFERDECRWIEQFPVN